MPYNAVEITRQALAEIGVKKVHRSETQEQAQRGIDLWFVPEEPLIYQRLSGEEIQSPVNVLQKICAEC